jgi:DNA mismatch endonuclease, patch repair protein
LSPPERSALMSKIRARDTLPEKKVRSLLHRAGFRFRLHTSDLPGKPDIVIPKHKTAVFVNGCFWHGHSCPKGTSLPKTRAQFWLDKINRTRERDQENLHDLRLLGWRIIVIWECELRDPAMLIERVAREIGA